MKVETSGASWRTANADGEKDEGMRFQAIHSQIFNTISSINPFHIINLIK